MPLRRPLAAFLIPLALAACTKKSPSDSAADKPLVTADADPHASPQTLLSAVSVAYKANRHDRLLTYLDPGIQDRLKDLIATGHAVAQHNKSLHDRIAAQFDAKLADDLFSDNPAFSTVDQMPKMILSEFAPIVENPGKVTINQKLLSTTLTVPDSDASLPFKKSWGKWYVNPDHALLMRLTLRVNNAMLKKIDRDFTAFEKKLNANRITRENAQQILDDLAKP